MDLGELTIILVRRGWKLDYTRMTATSLKYPNRIFTFQEAYDEGGIDHGN